MRITVSKGKLDKDIAKAFKFGYEEGRANFEKKVNNLTKCGCLICKKCSLRILCCDCPMIKLKKKLSKLTEAGK